MEVRRDGWFDEELAVLSFGGDFVHRVCLRMCLGQGPGSQSAERTEEFDLFVMYEDL